MKCPKCQFDNPEDHKFCGKCGHNFQTPEQPPPIDLTQPHSYTPKFLADKILTTRSAMEGERKRVTVLFADVAGFTSMSEKLDPEEVHQIMDGCFKILMDEIHNHQGTINQFTGDGVMALFGAPVAIENHAQNACQAALSIQNAMKKYSKELAAKSGLDFKMRIGLNSGPVIVGSIGDDLRMDYTAIGDTTNLAARMESMADPGTILVSPITYKRVGQFFKFEPLGKVTVKGKEAPLDAYKLTGKIESPGSGLNRQIFSEMVGRDDDLNKLELQINKAIAGDGSVVNVIGEAGIGKSRLIAELKNRDVVKRVTFLEGRAISIGRNLSFYPIIDLLKHWIRISEDDNEASSLGKLQATIRSVSQQDADEIIPFVATLMGMKLSGRYSERIQGIEGEPLEKLIFKNVKALLTKTSELTPLVIMIEDLHWSDTSSIELLEFLFRLAETQRILFINVFRPSHKETGERIIKTVKERLPVYYVQINLEPLNEKMSEILIDNMLDIKGLAYGIRSRIVQRSGGNPFFIEEVVRSFIDTGAIVAKGGKFEVTDEINRVFIPHTINDILMARIDRLEDRTRDLVKVASVIGRNFFYRILLEVANTIDEIDIRLSYLKQIELIRERQRMEELEYLFKHALAQEAAYDSILHQKRKDLHLQVARSIERIFDERLHEFYGMLALHFSKAEAYKNAEHYLIKAGEEAIRASASREALNYYQEGLKLYLQFSSDKKDSKKLAMFEKNIAIALYNKCRWIEAVEHMDKVFAHWNVAASPNRLMLLVKFGQNIIFIMTGLRRLFEKKNHPPSPRDNEIFNLLFKKITALSFFDNLRLFFVFLDGFNKVLKVDIKKSTEAIEIFTGTATIFSYCGLSFKFSHKILGISKSKIRINNIQNQMTYALASAVTNHCSGDWRKLAYFEETLIDEALKKGDLWNVTTYLWFFGITEIEKGHLENPERSISKLHEIAETFDFEMALIYACSIKAKLLVNKVQPSEAISIVEQAITLCRRTDGMIMLQLWYLGLKAIACSLVCDIEGAKESIFQAEKIIDQQRFIPCLFRAPSLVAQFIINIQRIQESINLMDEANLSSLKKRAYRSGKTALKKLKKYALYQAQALRLMGEYYWLIGKQKKALKWWDKAIKKGEKLGARPDLSRTYFQIGKSLLEPDSKYKELNGITAEEYLEKARTMFEEMDLQWDLDELDKVMAGR